MPRFTPVDWKTLERVFMAAGFRFARQEGRHRSYVKKRRFVILAAIGPDALDVLSRALLYPNARI